MGLSNELSCEAAATPKDFFQSEVLRFYFPIREPWVAWSVSLPSCSSQFIRMLMWDHPSPPVVLLPDCLSLLLLLVWINVSSLTPWLSDFHTVQFSGSSCCFLVLNLLLSLFWLCEEAQCIHLCLHHFREGKGGRLRGRETPIGFLPPTPNRGPGPQPRHVP